DVQQDVQYLISFIGKSGCSFYRNGSWSDSSAAQSHVRMKYDYLADRDQIANAGDFIEKAASKSSLTGSPYQVRCGMDAPVPSAAWLGEELRRYKSRVSSSRQAL